MEDIQEMLVAIADREAESVECGLPRWDVPLWDGIHFWAAGLGSKAMKKHVAALLKKWGRVLPQVDAVAWIERVVERAIAVERSRIRKALLTEFGPNRRINNVLGQKRVLVAVLDEICPEEP